MQRHPPCTQVVFSRCLYCPAEQGLFRVQAHLLNQNYEEPKSSSAWASAGALTSSTASADKISGVLYFSTLGFSSMQVTSLSSSRVKAPKGPDIPFFQSQRI